jgi:3-phosphoshikimate 1-carboxyvinyltransferase
MMQRACAAALLHNGITVIRNYGHSDDEHAALKMMQQLGATILSQNDREIIVSSKGISPKTNTIHCGESGLAARLFIPIASLSDKEIRVEGKGSLLQRPMNEFIKVLPQLGVQLEHQNSCLPFELKGPLQPKEIVVDGNMSSQFLSGLLFAFAFAAQEKTCIKVKDLKSKPYIDLTLQLLQIFGKEISHNNYHEFIINPTNLSKKETIEIDIEADWSSASFWLVGAVMNGNISIENLNYNSHQADRNILKAIEMATGKATTALHIFSKQTLHAFQFDATDCPDLFPVLAVLAGASEGTSSIKGLHRLTHKESNRKHSIMELLQQLGVEHSVDDDTLYISGRSSFEGATIHSHNDHRIVMAAAIAACKANAPIIINDAEAVSKSYPDFFAHLSSLGVECDLSSGT